MSRSDLTRRHALTGAALGVVGLTGACGEETGGDSHGTDPGRTDPDSSSAPRTSAPPSGGQPGDETNQSAAPPPDGLVATTDVPVGGGVVLAEENLVVTQPEAGTFKAFDATCTHQGCQVGSVDDSIHCPCHGSSYSITDGSVAGGPAPSPLPEKQVRVQGGQVVLG